MATNNEVKVIITGENKTGPAIAEAESGITSLGKKVSNLAPGFKAMAIGGTTAFASLSVAIGLSVREAIEAEAAQNRLTHILKTSRDATDEQINSLLRQADALEKVGVVSADSIVQAQAQLATFDLEAESIERLTPAILDYVVAEKGASASTEDLKALTNGLAQALQGNFASLTKTGFVLDDATKALIENGTEAERTAALVSVLNSTYEGFNESARQTGEGALVALRNEFNNLQQAIGQQLLPIIQQLAEILLPIVTQIGAWVQANPELTKVIIIATAAIAGLLAVVGTLGLLIPVIIAGFTLLLGPIGIITAAIVALGVAGAVLIAKWDEVKKFFTELWAGIKDTFKNAIDSIIGYFNPLFAVIERLSSAISSIGSRIAGVVSGGGGKTKARAMGGPVNPSESYLVGENGPELFRPKAMGNIVPNNRLGGSSITINISGNTLLDDSAAEKLSDQLMKALKHNLRFA